MNRQQIPSQKPELTRFQQRRLRGALLEVSGPLTCRPFPRDAWDRLGKEGCELESLWLDKPVDMCRAALAAAQLEGPAEFTETRARVERFFAVMLAETMVGFETRSPADLARQILELQRETAEVIVAAAEASHTTSEATLEQLREEAMEAKPVIDNVIAMTSARLATRPRSLVRT